MPAGAAPKEPNNQGEPPLVTVPIGPKGYAARPVALLAVVGAVLLTGTVAFAASRHGSSDSGCGSDYDGLGADLQSGVSREQYISFCESAVRVANDSNSSGAGSFDDSETGSGSPTEALDLPLTYTTTTMSPTTTTTTTLPPDPACIKRVRAAIVGVATLSPSYVSKLGHGLSTDAANRHGLTNDEMSYIDSSAAKVNTSLAGTGTAIGIPEHRTAEEAVDDPDIGQVAAICSATSTRESGTSPSVAQERTTTEDQSLRRSGSSSPVTAAPPAIALPSTTAPTPVADPPPTWVYSTINDKVEGYYQTLTDRYSQGVAGHKCSYSERNQLLISAGNYTCKALQPDGQTVVGTFTINVKPSYSGPGPDPVVTLVSM